MGNVERQSTFPTGTTAPCPLHFLCVSVPLWFNRYFLPHVGQSLPDNIACNARGSGELKRKPPVSSSAETGLVLGAADLGGVSLGPRAPGPNVTGSRNFVPVI